MLDQRTCTIRRAVAAAGAAVVVAAPAAALGQDPGEPPPADAAPVRVTVSAPSSVKHMALVKGVVVKVSCAPACSARLSFTGPIGIITQKTIQVAEGATSSAKLKATSSQARSLKKGAKLAVVVTGTGTDGGRGTATKTIKVR